MDSSTNGWAVYWTAPGKARIKISDTFTTSDWHHVRLFVNETGGHVLVEIDEVSEHEETALAFSETSRFAVGDTTDADSPGSGGGVGFYGELVSVPVHLKAPPDCGGVCENPSSGPEIIVPAP